MKPKNQAFNPPIGSLITFRASSREVADLIKQASLEAADKVSRETVDASYYRDNIMFSLANGSDIHSSICEIINNCKSVSRLGTKLPNVKFKWVLGDWEIFCIELPPQIRTIGLLGERYRLAFPWIYIFAGFHNGYYANFTAFYGKKPITSYHDPLYLPNLHQLEDGSIWPYRWCLGSELIAKSNTKNIVYDLIGAFWERMWSIPYEDMIKGKYSAGKFRKINTLYKWECFTERSRNCNGILELPWSQIEKSLGLYAESAIFDMFSIDKAFGDYSGIDDMELTKSAQRAVADLVKKVLDDGGYPDVQIFKKGNKKYSADVIRAGEELSGAIMARIAGYF